MRRVGSIALAVTAAVALSGSARADVWDNVDNTATGTTNEIFHGTEQRHDGAGNSGSGPGTDNDWFIVRSAARASYEFRVDGLNFNDGGTAVNVTRYDAAGTTSLTSNICGEGNLSKSTCWQQGATGAEERVRVSLYDADSGGIVSSADSYTARFYETSIGVPRYNNTGGQVTVLIIQNPSAYTINGTVFLWNASGALVTSYIFSTPAKATNVTNLATVVGGVANNTSGAVTIQHDGRYGDLAVKAVALEAATGFSFDSPGLFRAH
jgi:hypothetical protein